MSYLQNRLAVLKIMLNSHYGNNFTFNVYEETYKIKKKIFVIKSRREKIKRIFNA